MFGPYFTGIRPPAHTTSSHHQEEVSCTTKTCFFIVTYKYYALAKKIHRTYSKLAEQMRICCKFLQKMFEQIRSEMKILCRLRFLLKKCHRIIFPTRKQICQGNHLWLSCGECYVVVSERPQTLQGLLRMSIITNKTKDGPPRGPD